MQGDWPTMPGSASTGGSTSRRTGFRVAFEFQRAIVSKTSCASVLRHSGDCPGSGSRPVSSSNRTSIPGKRSWMIAMSSSQSRSGSLRSSSSKRHSLSSNFPKASAPPRASKAGIREREKFCMICLRKPELGLATITAGSGEQRECARVVMATFYSGLLKTRLVED
jgi:hypothetical protein